MNVLLIIAIILGYIIIGGIVAGIMTYVDGMNDIGFGCFAGCIWPAAILLFLVIAMGILPFKLGEVIVRRFKKWLKR